MADAKSFANRNIAIRIVKPYAGARSHIYTGRAIDYDGRFVTIDGCVLHFGKPTVDDPTGGLTTSPRAIRWVALQRIEYIRELPDDMDSLDPRNIKVIEDGSLGFRVSDRPDLLPE